MKSSCLIMMASYNGEKYIEEQIVSIISQDYENWHLVIQDDGSKDTTVEIVKKYVEQDSRIELWINTYKHGAYYNFHSMINKCKSLKYDYYLFVDHDDIWLPFKLKEMVNYCKNNTLFDLSIPIMVYADMSIIDAKGNITNRSIHSILGLQYGNWRSSFFNHNVFGCNTIMNRALFKIVPKMDLDVSICKIMSHDNYYAKYAAIKGKLIYFNKITMLYRRYGNNVTAQHSYNNNFSKIIKRLSNVDKLAEDHARTYNQSLYTIEVLKKCNDLSNEELKNINEIEKVIRLGGINAVIYFIKYKIFLGSKMKTLSRESILALGKYKKYLNYKEYTLNE